MSISNHSSQVWLKNNTIIYIYYSYLKLPTGLTALLKWRFGIARRQLAPLISSNIYIYTIYIYILIYIFDTISNFPSQIKKKLHVFKPLMSWASDDLKVSQTYQLVAWWRPLSRTCKGYTQLCSGWIIKSFRTPGRCPQICLAYAYRQPLASHNAGLESGENEKK
jgi:hypothetical protein